MNEGLKLNIKNSPKSLCIGLGLFSTKEDLESFINQSGLNENLVLENKEKANSYLIWAMRKGLSTEIW